MSARVCFLVFLLAASCGASVVDNANDLNWLTLRKYFMYSMSSFCSAEVGLANWTCSWCQFLPIPPLQNITIFETPGWGMGAIYGYVGRSNESIVIAFRGSSTVQNWILDFEFTHTAYPPVQNATVHIGFLKGYMQVASIITPIVQKLQYQYPNLTVISTGHSLGAALSLLNGAGLVQAGVKNVQVWNYGQPRVGNAIFANYTMKAIDIIYRAVNEDDTVPHLPPQNFGYHHVATELWFATNETTYIICNHSGEDPSCSDSVSPLHYSDFDHLVYLGYGPNGLKPPNAC